MKMNFEFEVKLPNLPNFISVERVVGAKHRTELKETAVDKIQYPVGDLSEEQLREIGKQWTEALVAHAKKQRENKLGGS